MQPFPHHYQVGAVGQPEGTVTVSSAGLPELETTPPPDFDGPEGYWSPETLLVASVSDCFILTFRGIAKANKLPWARIECDTDGILQRVDRVTRFTELRINVSLHVPAGTDEAKAHRLLEKAEQSCLITNSFIADTVLETKVVAAA